MASQGIGNVNDLSAIRSWVLLVITSALVFATIAVVAVVTVRTVDRLSDRPLRTTALLPTT